MRFGVSVSEAARNLLSGTTRALLFSAILAGVTATLVAVEFSTTSALIVRTREYVEAGASTYVLTAEDNIDAQACAKLSTSRSIAQSGALKSAPSTPIAALRGNPVPTFEGTAGLLTILGGGAGTSLMASEDLARTISPPLADGATRVRVAGLQLDRSFDWPDDGRDTALEYALVGLSERGRFDQCWVVMSDPTVPAGTLLYSALVRDPHGPGEAEVTQLNGRQGSHLTTFDDFPLRPSRWFWAVSFVIGAILGGAAVRLRAVELTSAAAIGVNATSQLAQLLVETLAWALSGAMMTLVFGMFYSQILGLRNELLPLAMPIIAGSVIGVVVATAVVWRLMLRRPVDHYLRSRSG